MIPELQRRMPPGPRHFFDGFREKWGRPLDRQGRIDTNRPEVYLDFLTRFRRQLGEVQVEGVVFYLTYEDKGTEREELLPAWVSTIPRFDGKPQTEVSTDLPVVATDKVKKALGINIRGISARYDVGTREFSVEAIGPLNERVDKMGSEVTYTPMKAEDLRRARIGIGIRRLKMLVKGSPPLPQLEGDQRII